MRIGIIGSGSIGGTLTRRLRDLGHEVVVANSRGPASLADLVAETGARAGTVEEAVQGADAVVVAVPLGAVPDLSAAPFDGVVVIDACNYYPQRDGRLAAIDQGTTSSRWVADHLRGARVVKAFNTIQAAHLLELGQPQGQNRIALPVAGDDEQAKRLALALVDALGFDAVDAGPLDDSWRQEPGTPVYGTVGSAADVSGHLASAVRP